MKWVYSILILAIGVNLYANEDKLALIDKDELSLIKKLNSLKGEIKKYTLYPKSKESIITSKENKDILQKDNNQTQNISIYSPKDYLSLKQIFYPMPQDYAHMYLKMKTLENPAQKILKVYINKRRQRMSVYLENKKLYEWRVSTARRGYWTPRGTFRPYSLERMHYSRKYHNSPMPYSVFFKGGYAIHGTYSISRLGRPASHGCVRIHPRNAKKLYSLIRRNGKRNTKIIIY